MKCLILNYSYSYRRYKAELKYRFSFNINNGNSSSSNSFNNFFHNGMNAQSNKLLSPTALMSGNQFDAIGQHVMPNVNTSYSSAHYPYTTLANQNVQWQ